MQKLLYVRNRAAHHEPIHRRNLIADAAAADELLGWACEDSRLWSSAHSSLPLIVSRKP